MPLSSAAVTIADDGAETLPANSMATAIYNGMKASVEAQYGPLPTGADGANQKKGLAVQANGIAAGVVSDIVANGDVTVGASDGGLQRSTALGMPTNGPASPVTITGAIS